MSNRSLDGSPQGLHLQTGADGSAIRHIGVEAVADLSKLVCNRLLICATFSQIVDQFAAQFE